MARFSCSDDRDLPPEHLEPSNLVLDAHRALQQAVDFSLNCQQPDGDWVAPVSADATFTAQYVMFKYAYSTPGLCLSAPESDAIRRWLLEDQRAHGGWALAPDLPGNVSTSVEAYLALRLLGVPRSHPDMKRAANFILSEGGVARVRFFTRFFLATYGLVPWAAIPQMPAELILLPSWAKPNIYVLSSWARSTLIPILVVRHHEPVYSLPMDEDKSVHDDTSSQSKDVCSDFLDEIWVDPSNKNVPISRPLWDCLLGPEQDRDVVEGLFTAADNILSQGWISSRMNSGRSPIRKQALKKCMNWILDHQEDSGDWAGFFPPIHGSVWALLLQGYPVHHKSVRMGLEALERLAVHDSGGKWIQSTISACWDTALVVNALCDARMALSLEPQEDRDRISGMEKAASAVRLGKPLSKAAAWLRSMQLMVDHGDWRIYSKTQQAGGWSFEYYNSFYPDVDDTAVVIMTLVNEDPHAIHSECIANAVEWILGMQNRDGGWGAFDINNDARWLHKIPFSDMDSLVDPSTADVTGRTLECFGFLLDHRREHQHLALGSEMRRRLLEASKPALEFLLATQEDSGAWWGRWGNNYNYGTTNVLRGLANGDFWRASPAVHKATLRAVRWLLDCQNADGGWGETLLSYADPAKAGRGESTAAQTAWALDSILRFCPASSPACQRGVMWLIKNQSETPACRTGAYSVTAQVAGREDGTFSIKLEQKPEDCTGASWPIDRYVGTGFPKFLYLGYPFYHHVFPIQALSRYVDCVHRQQSWAATTDDLPVPAAVSAEMNRPHALLMALGGRGNIDAFLSIAQRLRGSCRVRIATHATHQACVQEHGFEFYDVGGGPEEYAGVLGDAHGGVVASNIKQLVKGGLRLAALRRNWLAFGLFLNKLRVGKYGMHTTTWASALREGISEIPHICLWSSHLFQRPSEWPENVVIGGSTSLLPKPGKVGSSEYRPSDPLHDFVLGHNQEVYRRMAPCSKERPLIVVSFGSMSIYNSAAVLSLLSSALDRVNARAVVCANWDITDTLHGKKVPGTNNRIYVTDQSIPLAWLLRHASGGFVQHGGAGHTRAGLRADVPMLLLPSMPDQHFWAAHVHKLGLGPPPVPFRLLTADRLTGSLRLLLDGSSSGKGGAYALACAEMAERVRAEGDGADVAAEVITRQLGLPGATGAASDDPRLGAAVSPAGSSAPPSRMPCSVFPALVGRWAHKATGLPLSGAAAACLVSESVLGWDDLEVRPGVGEGYWSGHERSLAAWVRILERVTNFVSFAGGIFKLWLLLTCLAKLELARTGSRGGSLKSLGQMSDVCRRAHLEQAEYDLGFLLEQSRGCGEILDASKSGHESVYYLPTWFQSIQGVDSAQFGVRILPTMIKMILGSVVGGFYNAKIGYYTPLTIIGSCVMSIGAELMTTFWTDTPQGQWIGYQVIYGTGMGFCFQVPNPAMQAVLPKADRPVGLSVMLFCNLLSSTVFVSVGADVLNTQLLDRLVTSGGATSLVGALPAAERAVVLTAYNASLQKVFQIALVLCCVSVIGCATLEWKNVRRSGDNMATAEATTGLRQ
ncbi:hypothetical protein Daus18300_003983 [Diaporthe australafricana]|uniref:Uncharacterized protein n=1 Tax=Diaporthe australafricana TaxID=127596 RepID=A0ABR3XC14_9PEZI